MYLKKMIGVINSEQYIKKDYSEVIPSFNEGQSTHYKNVESLFQTYLSIAFGTVNYDGSSEERIIKLVEGLWENAYNDFILETISGYLRNYNRIIGQSTQPHVFQNSMAASIVSSMNTAYQNEMKLLVSNIKNIDFNEPNNAVKAAQIKKVFQESQSRLLRKIFDVQVAGSMDALSYIGAAEYVFRSESAKNTCSSCQSLHGQTFAIRAAQPGVNYPPIHPNCKCTIELTLNRSDAEDVHAVWGDLFGNLALFTNEINNFAPIGTVSDEMLLYALLGMPEKLERGALDSLPGTQALNWIWDNTTNQIMISPEERKLHYAHNIQYQPILSANPPTIGYIIDQSQTNQFQYGKHTGEYNGCSWISIYNAMHAIGDQPEHPADLIYYLESTPHPFTGDVLGGRFGSYPWSVEQYFKDHGYKTKSSMDAGEELHFYDGAGGIVSMPNPNSIYNVAKQGDAGIVLFFRKDGTAHYVAFQNTGRVDSSGKEIYDFYNASYSQHHYDASLQDFLKQEGAVTQYVISISK